MIGTRHRRLGGDRLARGAGQFVADVRVPGMAEAAVLRSPHAHARLGAVDARRALALPGVLAVLTAADVPTAIIPNRRPGPEGMERYLQPAIARERVRYAGEPVALVVARDRHVAADALELIAVDYEPLPALTTVAAALAAGAPRLFPRTDSNNVATISMRVGDADRALAGASVIVRERFRHPRQAGSPLETRGLVVVPPAASGGELHLIGATKCLHTNRQMLAGILGLPPGTLRLTEVDVGGGFGVRGELYPEDILVPLAALRLGRPVRWIEERRENLAAAHHARETEYEVELGLDAGGVILGLRATIRADIGAYVRTTGLIPGEYGGAMLPGPYRVPHYACDVLSVVTNKSPAGPLRSPGRPEANFARERLMELAAARLRLDAVELRRRNVVTPREMPYAVGTSAVGSPTVYDTGDFPALLDEVARRLAPDRARGDDRGVRRRGQTAAPADQGSPEGAGGGRRVGVGLALYVEKTGAGPFETAALQVTADGHVIVDTGASSMGPGLETVLAQIAGEALGLPPDRFEVRHPDTAMIESGVGTYASRATIGAGNAVHAAAARLIAEARVRVATLWGVEAGEVAYAAGALSCKGHRATLAELAARARLAVGASFEITHATCAGGAAGAVVEVDEETGAVRVRRLVIGADVGRAVNPALVEGQMVGGAVFGLGNAVLESVEYDAAGQLLSGSLMDYALPMTADLPAVEVFYQEVRATTNPLGLRGLGESANPGLGAAIANAVCDALRARGVNITTLPLTPARVRAAMAAALLSA